MKNRKYLLPKMVYLMYNSDMETGCVCPITAYSSTWTEVFKGYAADVI